MILGLLVLAFSSLCFSLRPIEWEGCWAFREGCQRLMVIESSKFEPSRGDDGTLFAGARKWSQSSIGSPNPVAVSTVSTPELFNLPLGASIDLGDDPIVMDDLKGIASSTILLSDGIHRLMISQKMAMKWYMYFMDAVSLFKTITIYELAATSSGNGNHCPGWAILLVDGDQDIRDGKNFYKWKGCQGFACRTWTFIMLTESMNSTRFYYKEAPRLDSRVRTPFKYICFTNSRQSRVPVYPVMNDAEVSINRTELVYYDTTCPASCDPLTQARCTLGLECDPCPCGSESDPKVRNFYTNCTVTNQVLRAVKVVCERMPWCTPIHLRDPPSPWTKDREIVYDCRGGDQQRRALIKSRVSRNCAVPLDFPKGGLVIQGSPADPGALSFGQKYRTAKIEALWGDEEWINSGCEYLVNISRDISSTISCLGPHKFLSTDITPYSHWVELALETQPGTPNIGEVATVMDRSYRADITGPEIDQSCIEQLRVSFNALRGITQAPTTPTAPATITTGVKTSTRSTPRTSSSPSSKTTSSRAETTRKSVEAEVLKQKLSPGEVSAAVIIPVLAVAALAVSTYLIRKKVVNRPEKGEFSEMREVRY